MRLPDRLLAIAGFVSPGSVVADIGTDHALLPIYLVNNGIAEKVIATDLNPGPLEAARKNILAAGLTDRISVRLGDGLQVLQTGEVQEVVIAGMGGGTIKAIISSDMAKARLIRKFILQPMADSGFLRIWLSSNGWKFVDEELVKEDGRIYEVMAVSPGKEDVSDEFLISIGPRLYEKKHPLLKELLQSETARIQKIILGLEKSRDSSAQAKLKEFLARKKSLEWIIECL